MTCDFVRDPEKRWWLLQVKSLKLQKACRRSPDSHIGRGWPGGCGPRTNIQRRPTPAVGPDVAWRPVPSALQMRAGPGIPASLGAQDHKPPPPAGSEMQAAAQRCSFIEVPHAGHTIGRSRAGAAAGSGPSPGAAAAARSRSPRMATVRSEIEQGDRGFGVLEE
jgi:hypothetical protein